MYKGILTNPEQHNPNDFAYLVHAMINPFGEVSKETMIKKVQAIKNPARLYRASLISRMDKETASRRLYTYSGIDITETFGSFGMIINPADDKVIQIAWNTDIGSPEDQEELKKFVSQYWRNRKPAWEILANPVGPVGIRYNELIVAGHEDSSITGVFYRAPSSDNLAEAKELLHLCSQVAGKELPLVELPAFNYNEYADLKPEERDLRKRVDKLAHESTSRMFYLQCADRSRTSLNERLSSDWRTR